MSDTVCLRWNGGGKFKNEIQFQAATQSRQPSRYRISIESSVIPSIAERAEGSALTVSLDLSAQMGEEDDCIL